MSKILLSGNDFRLLETRAALLRKTGANVSFGNATVALEILNREKISVMVFCHSLGEEEVAMLVEKIREKNAQIKTLMVITDFYRDGKFRNIQFDAIVLPDPPDLIVEASRLLQAAGTTSPVS